MEQSFIHKFISHFTLLFVAIAAGIMTLRKLSTGQKIIFAQLISCLVFAIWSLFRINNGLYSAPVVSIAEFICYGIELAYIDWELKEFKKKSVQNNWDNVIKYNSPSLDNKW